MRSRIRVLFATMVAASLLFAVEANAEEPAPPAVTAMGRAEIEMPPDRAVVMMGVRATGKTAAEATRAGATRSQQVLDALRAKLAPGDRAESASNRVEPITVYDSGKPPRVTGFASEHGLRAVTAKVAEVGSLLDAVTGAADVAIESVRFELADASTVQAEALSRASRDARARASAIAEGLGASLGRVRLAREIGRSMPAPVGEFAMRTMAAEPTPVVPPQLRVAGEVEVTFELVSGARP